MKHYHLILALGAGLVALSACDRQADAPATDAAATETAAAPVDLPPAVVASKIYRCKDSSVVYIDFLSKTGTIEGSTMATLKTDNAGPTTALTKAEGATAYTAEGHAVEGTGDSVTVTLPGKPAQSCNA